MTQDYLEGSHPLRDWQLGRRSTRRSTRRAPVIPGPWRQARQTQNSQESSIICTTFGVQQMGTGSHGEGVLLEEEEEGIAVRSEATP